MADSPRIGDSDLVTVDVRVDDQRIHDTFFVTRIQVVHEINRIPFARIMISDGNVSDSKFEISERADFEPGRTIEIRAGYHGEHESIFKGIIVKHSIKVQGGGRSSLVLTCNDKALKLTVARNNARFFEKTDSEVIEELITNAELSADVEQTSVQHEQRVQNNATDWDYLVTRAEVNGQIVIVNDGSVSVGKPEVSGDAELVVRLGDSIMELNAELDAVSQLPLVTCKGWDSTNQSVLSSKASEPSVNKQGNLDGKALVKTLNVKEFELQSFGDQPKDGLESWANAQLLKSRLARIRGRVSFPGNSKPHPGGLVELAGLGKRFNGKAFVSSVQHVIEAGDWTTQVGFGLSRTWFSEQHNHVQAVPAAGLQPGTTGLQIAKVKQTHEDPRGERRIKVSLPMVNDAQDDLWVRIASPYATSTAGICFLPEEGDEVVIGFLDSDPGSPIVLGSLHSVPRPAPCVPDSENRNKAIVSKSQMKISFDDVDKVLQIETPGGHIVSLSDKEQSILITDSNQNTMTMDSTGISLNTPKDVSIKATGKVMVEGTGGIDLKSSADLTQQGQNIEINADAALSAKGAASAELSASGQTSVKGATVMIN